MLQIFGDSDEKGHLGLFDVRVHKILLLSEGCPAVPNRNCNFERTQQILTKSLLPRRSILPPGPLPPESCVIISRSRQILRSSKWRLAPPSMSLPSTNVISSLSEDDVADDSNGSQTSDSESSGRIEITPLTSLSQNQSQNDKAVSCSTTCEAIYGDQD